MTRRVITPRGQNVLTRVCELIDPYTGSWDHDLLEQTFWEEDVEIIKAIPVHQDMDDVIAWHFDGRGLFSVRSAYKVHRENLRLEDGRIGSSSSQEENRENIVWKKLWKLDCPGKIKHFLWRLGHNSLALRVNLKRRRMEIDTRRVVCNRLVEDGCHLVCKCKFVKCLWQDLNLEPLRSRLAELPSAREMLLATWELEEKELLTVVLLLWHWWLERNRIREGERSRDPAVITFIIRAQVEEFLNMSKKGNTSSPVQRKKWTRPAGDMLKINSDGAYNPTTRKGGWGLSSEIQRGE